MSKLFLDVMDPFEVEALGVCEVSTETSRAAATGLLVEDSYRLLSTVPNSSVCFISHLANGVALLIVRASNSLSEILL